MVAMTGTSMNELSFCTVLLKDRRTNVYVRVVDTSELNAKVRAPTRIRVLECSEDEPQESHS